MTKQDFIKKWGFLYVEEGLKDDLKEITADLDSLSLPPADATAEEIEVSHPTDKELTTAHSVLAYQYDLSEDDVKTALLNYSKPTAEGAEHCKTCGTCKWQHAKYEYKCEDCRGGINNYEPDQPTAEGAEEILRNILASIWWGDPVPADAFNNPDYKITIADAKIIAERFAALTADKIVEGKYADTEADGYVFCGKCGKMKEI